MRLTVLVVGLVVLAAQPAVADATVLNVSPHHLSFGKQAFDTFTTGTVTVTNTGSTAVLVAVEALDVPDDISPGQPESTCPLTEATLLQAGATCAHVVGYSPSRTFVGRQSATLRITARDPALGAILDTSLVKISGRGVAP